MMGVFRKIFRILLLFPWLVFMAVFSAPVRLRRDPWAVIFGMTRMIRLWGRGLLRIFNIRLTVFGDAESCYGGLIVSNHMGYVDVFVHSAVFGLRFAPKVEVRSWPVLGWYTSLTHPIWIDRSSRLKTQKSLEEFRETLKHRVPLIVYPEGTSTDGTTVLPFKSSLFEVVLEGDFAIQPILTIYRVPEGADSPCWYGDQSLMPHVWRLLGIPWIEAEVHILPPVRAEGRDRKTLAALTHEVIAKAHEKYKLDRGPAAGPE
ncbi:MAG: 1-acyl-sn-glycerol-3-phosphate acyltransferase [Lentisphaerae bacterium ADurb.Bin242]|nr:MAG: 1-acyl-sn-glycerol-3-phosphate acyltransferase [Lentisphaerae bacterium ADurb.Bin242]